MTILGIETSCDETAAAIIHTDHSQPRVTVLSNIFPSSMALHAQTGGIIPEVAAREQIKYIIPVIKQALDDAHIQHPEKEIDAIAVTIGPGLIGSLLIGVETAKTLSCTWNTPIIPVNHLYGHIYANWIDSSSQFSVLSSQKKVNRLSVTQSDKRKTEKLDSENRKQKTDNSVTIPFPALALVVSGGHTDLVLLKAHGNIVWLGGTRDDAAGEAFDKIGRMLGFPYPAGPAIEQAAKKGNPKAHSFPRPLMYDKTFDFSFSGLKTAAMREIQKSRLDEQTVNTISRGIQDAIIDVLVYKTIKAAQQYRVSSLLLAGGVAANQTLRDTFADKIEHQIPSVIFFTPEKNLCTDNAAMIATAGFYNDKRAHWQDITANPELYFD